MMTSIHELLQKEAQAVLNIPITDAYEKAVELIVEQIHRKKGKLVTTGMGKLRLFALQVFRQCFYIPAKLNMGIWGFCRRMICCF